MWNFLRTGVNPHDAHVATPDHVPAVVDPAAEPVR
jgi:hypothetical protein